jgi:hypothetical protein
MALGNFLPQEQDLIIGIFFRIGYWISHVDDTDVGDASEAIEQKQMLAALKKVAGSTGATELVREIAEEAVRRSGDQARWLKNEDRVLVDVTKAVQLIHSNGTEEDFKSFRKSLMFVATSVARAYREEPDHAEQEGMLGKLLEKAGQMLTAVSDNEAYKDMNISPAEDTALHELAQAISRA